MEKPVLSICIPTYNRKKYLERQLQSIVCQSIFRNTNEIEIIISDNCSTDNTEVLCQKYFKLYPNKIIYNRNKSNIGAAANFQKVFTIANGKFLKFSNDYIIYDNDSLEYMLNIIKVNMCEKPTLVFTNGFLELDKEISSYKKLDEFIKTISYYCTWTIVFGLWREEFAGTDILLDKSKSFLPQVSFMLALLSNKKNLVIVNKKIFSIPEIHNKGGNYNIAEVFGKNYLNILKQYLKNKTLSLKSYHEEKKKILLNIINPFYFNVDNEYNFKQTGYMKYLIKDYKYNLYFYIAFFKMIYKKYIFRKYKNNKHRIIKIFSIKIKFKLKENAEIKQWEQINPKNFVSIKKHIDCKYYKNIKVGIYSYGEIDVYINNETNNILNIGNFCSIAPDVKFILASDHEYKILSTYPFKYFLIDNSNEAISKGNIIVNDDVWIGTNSIILSGVTIGQGAIVGAGSIVTKNVPPYAIVAGNPAKIVKYRFSKEIITKLLQIDYSKLNKEKVQKLEEVLYTEITENNVDDIVNIIKCN